METVVQPPADAELHLLTEWSEPGRGQRTRTAAALSFLAHAALILLVLLLPKEAFQPPPQPERHVTTLIEPLTPLTQKAPNTSKVSKEFNIPEVRPRPRLQAPSSPPPVLHAAAPRPAALPPMPVPKPAQPVALPEPPKLEAAAKAPASTVDLPGPVGAPPPPPPQIQAQEKPKVTFENPTTPSRISSGHGKVPIPGSPVEEAIREAARGNTPGGLVVGDLGASDFGGYGGGINLPYAPGLQGSNLQLLSNPMGVDFRPYLTQILATVRRNWMNVMPESVLRLGRRGKVAIQFSIARDGHVPKLVIASSSGTDPLDRAAVAGISASNPFPPLPVEFKGDRIVVQFNFAYNMPRQ
jgi:TonB family protein